MDGLDREEYRVLRSTIGRRGTIRSVLFLSGIIAWSAVLTVVLGWLPYPLASLLPLIILVATFEAIRPLHFGAERIGRYIQAFYEEAGNPQSLAVVPSWEKVAMVFGGSVPGAAGHPLFAPVFGMATLVNYLAVVIPGPVAIELGSLAVPHVAFLAWLIISDRAVRSQRAIELARFRELRDREGLRF